MKKKVFKGQEVVMTMAQIVAQEDAEDGILCGYPEVVLVFNEVRNERFITEKKLTRKAIEMFPKHTISETVIRNFILRTKKRLSNPPIKKSIDGLYYKSRNVSKEEVAALTIPYAIWERQNKTA